MIPLTVTLVLVLVLALLMLRGLFLGYPPPIIETSVLGTKDQALVAAVADAMFPANGPIPLSGTEAGLVSYMHQHLAPLGQKQRALVKVLFWFLEHAPWIMGPRHARFTKLSQAERIRVLHTLATSRIYFCRIAFLSMRTMLTMGYLANAEVAKEVGMIASPSPFEPRRTPASERPPRPRLHTPRHA